MMPLRWFFSTLKFGVDELVNKSYNGCFVVEPGENMRLTLPLNSRRVFKLKDKVYKFYDKDFDIMNQISQDYFPL